MSSPLPANHQFAELLELVLLGPAAKEPDVMDLCDAAERLGITRVCVNSIWIDALHRRLEGTKITPVVTVGYPLGAMMQQAVAYEAECAFQQGAQAITMVMPQGLVRMGQWNLARDYIATVANAVPGVPLTVVIDPVSLGTYTRIGEACRCAWWCGAACVAAFARDDTGGADLDHFPMMNRHLRSRKMGLMAIGGVNPQNIEALLEFGVTRIGTHTSMAAELLARRNGSSSNFGMGY